MENFADTIDLLQLFLVHDELLDHRAFTLPTTHHSFNLSAHL
jgi:hypothetical protein